MSDPIDITTARKRGTSKQRQVASSPYRSDATPYPDRIIGARELAGYSLAQLATLTGIAESDLALFESGLSIPTHEQLLRIGQETGFLMAWFYQSPNPAWPGLEQTTLRFH
jgi:ribosome-binding protein aMBF1 (putative translation factor)